MANLKVIELPDRNLSDTPDALRALATAIEEGRYGTATHCVWVLAADDREIEVGMTGQSPSPGAEAHLLLAMAMRKLESV